MSPTSAHTAARSHTHRPARGRRANGHCALTLRPPSAIVCTTYRPRTTAHAECLAHLWTAYGASPLPAQPKAKPSNPQAAQF